MEQIQDFIEEATTVDTVVFFDPKSTGAAVAMISVATILVIFAFFYFKRFTEIDFTTYLCD